MTYRYKTQIQLCLNTGDRADHMYDKTHAQQQQQRRVMQTLHRTTLTRKTKSNHYEKLDLNNICDNKKFGSTVKPLFSNKIKSAENIVLTENGKYIKDEEIVANIFSDFFVNIVPNLGIMTQHEFLNTTDNSQDRIENAISKYENHPSIILIKNYLEGTNSSFVFETI